MGATDKVHAMPLFPRVTRHSLRAMGAMYPTELGNYLSNEVHLCEKNVERE